MTDRVDAALPLYRDPLLVVYAFIVLAVGLPARLIVPSLGGVGAPATIVAAGAVLLYALARLLPGDFAGGSRPMRAVLLTFGFVALMSYAVGQANALPAIQSAASDRTLITYAGYVALGLIVNDCIRDRRHLDRLLGLIVIAASVLAVLGLVQFVTGLAPDTYIKIPGLVLQQVDITTIRSDFTRVQGTTLHPIEFGVVLAVVLPIALHYAVYGTGITAPSRWRWLPVLLIFVASPMAVSRSSVVGMVVGTAVLAVAWTARKRLNAAVAALVLLVAMRAAFPGLLGTLRSMFTFFDDDPSIEGRTQDYPLVLELFRQSPWLGRGLGTFVPSEFFFVDNEYLGTVVTAGLLGLGALVLLFVVAFALGRGVYHHSHDPAARSLGQALAAAAAVSAVTWATYDGLGFRFNAGLAFVLFGAVGTLWRLEVGQFNWGEAVNRHRPATPRLLPTPAQAPTGQGELAELDPTPLAKPST